MCDFSRMQLFWYELLPYVDVSANTSILNRTGVVYDFFRESIAECCDSSNATAQKIGIEHERLPHQQAVLNAVHNMTGSVGMPISLDTEFPHTPSRFVPVLATDGLFWVKVKEPKTNLETLERIGTNGLSLLLVVITMTGYAAVILWLLEARSAKCPQFHRSFLRGIAESYWCTFITATTIGYGDKVAKSTAGKLFTMLWILFGICLMSTFTAITTTVMAAFMLPSTSKPKPFYDEFIGVLEGSFDSLVLVKKSANSVRYPDTDSLTEALNNGSTFNIVIDKHAYWVYRAKIHQNQSFEFRPGVQNPTSIGYVYNTNNSTLLQCLKNYAMSNQVKVTARLEELVKEAIEAQPPDKPPEEMTPFFGSYTYAVLAAAVGVFFGICALGGIIDYTITRTSSWSKSRSRSRSDSCSVRGSGSCPGRLDDCHDPRCGAVNEDRLSEIAGKEEILVNTESCCNFTPQLPS